MVILLKGKARKGLKEYHDSIYFQLDRLSLVSSVSLTYAGHQQDSISLIWVPAVLFTCDFYQAELLEMHHDTILIIDGDTTYDSLGFCASYCLST